MYTKVFSELDQRLNQRDALGVAKAFGVMTNQGILNVGDKLPPIRLVAKHLGISSATITKAWAILAAHGMIETNRRNGTTIKAKPTSGRSRYWQVPTTPGALPVDLSTGTPDPKLLPGLEPILRRITPELAVHSYVDRPVLPELELQLRALWPFDPEALTVTDGALDGFQRAMQLIVSLGDLVAVEDPTYPPLLDALELLGVETISLEMDNEGPRCEAIEAALNQKGLRAVVIQTGAHNPTGSQLSSRRLKQIVDLVTGTDVKIVEDAQGWAVDRAFMSAGAALPDQTIRIHSFSKTHGPDLRLAAISGSTDLIEAIVDRRQIGPGWTSRLTQRLLAEMLADNETETQVHNALTHYQQRREALAHALAEQQIAVSPAHGINLWVPVNDEHMSTVALAAQGIGVAPGAPFRLASELPTQQHIRVTTASISQDVEQIAKAIASGAKGRTLR